MKKRVRYILEAKGKKITPDESVLQALPHREFRFANPLILIHHLGPQEIKPGSEFRIQPHPHRGFTPVTFQLQGEGYHKDNAGNDKLIKAGCVQWMFSGSGILHSEGPSKSMLKSGGVYEFIQVWINVPSGHKRDAPVYQSALRKDLPKIFGSKEVDLRLVSGNYDNVNGPINSYTPVISIFGEIKRGQRIQLMFQPGYWTVIYVAKGLICNHGESIMEHHLLIFEKENEEVIIIAEEDSLLLILSAEPISEPLAVKDNFVMNTPEEVDRAFADFKNGRFGDLDF